MRGLWSRKLEGFCYCCLMRAFVEDGNGFDAACLSGKMYVFGVLPFDLMRHEDSRKIVNISYILSSPPRDDCNTHCSQ